MNNTKPRPKIQAAGAGGAVSILAVFIAGQFGLEMDAEVGGAIATLTAVAFGYLKPEPFDPDA